MGSYGAIGSRICGLDLQMTRVCDADTRYEPVIVGSVELCVTPLGPHRVSIPHSLDDGVNKVLRTSGVLQDVEWAGDQSKSCGPP